MARLRGLAAAGAPAQAAPVPAGAWLTCGLARAQLHEIYAGEVEDAAAAAGFSVGLALAADRLPLVWVRLEGGERAAGRLHATGLVELGLAPDEVVLVVAADEGALLRAAGDAARCPGVGTLLMESWGRMPALDLTATRRLVLAAEASGVTVLSLRLGAEPVPSAAATRWRVGARPSVALDADAPGLPAFDVECLRRRGGPAGEQAQVEWNRDTRSFRSPGPQAGADAAPLAGAGLSLVAGGAAAGDAPAPVRRSG